ncbi:hypothetical protein ABIA35_009863 [Catenulispora sp. MAP12-49]|uniref:DUF1918 domain-containing protein n=1 Tax=Catenulispora sp. MAP12-49 TaxID=3156302 RepID=UPI0035185139
MKAVVGDRIAIMSRHLDEAVREGEIIEVHGAAGGPPYVVRWLDSGHTGVLFPGPDAQVRHLGGTTTTAGGAAGHGSEPIRAENWQVTVAVVEYEGGKTKCHVIAHTGLRAVQAHGEAQRLAGDVEVPQIGDEVAVGRAFITLGEELLGEAVRDIEDIEGRRHAVVPRSPADPAE